MTPENTACNAVKKKRHNAFGFSSSVRSQVGCALMDR